MRWVRVLPMWRPQFEHSQGLTVGCEGSGPVLALWTTFQRGRSFWMARFSANSADARELALRGGVL